MLILFAPILLLGTALALGVARVLRPRFRFMWLASFGVATVGWIGVLLWQLQLPTSLVLPGWGSTVPIGGTPVLAANTLSWVLSFGLVSLLTASLLIAPAQPDFRNSLSWPVSLGFAGLALLAVTADNLLTIVPAWAALDLADVSLSVRWANGRDSSKGAVAAFSVRMASLALVLLALALSGAGESASSNNVLLIAAVGLRLVVLPAQLDSTSAAHREHGIGIVLPLASTAATLGLLSHVQLTGPDTPFRVLLLLLSAGMALYAGWMWLGTSDDINGEPFLLLGLSSLAMGAALQGNPVGATGWGLALVLAGGSLFLSGARQTRLNHAVLIGAWSLSALPFSISAAAWRLQAGPAVWALPAFVLAQALLLAAFLRQATRASTQALLDSQPAWLRGMFYAGLGLMVLMQLVLGFWGWDGARQAQSWPAGMAATALGLAMFWARSRLRLAGPRLSERIQRVSTVSGSAVAAILRPAYQALQELMQGVTNLLEGDAGIMWGLLLVALFVSLIVGGNP